jgi:hypothetical protein
MVAEASVPVPSKREEVNSTDQTGENTMTFLKVQSGGLVNADQIVQITEMQASTFLRNGTCRAKLSNETVITLAGGEEEIRQRLQPVVAAAPGFVLLRLYLDPDDLGKTTIMRSPVVAWRIDGDFALPIAPEDEDAGCFGDGVLMPDKRVVQSHGRTFPNEEEWAAGMSEDVEYYRKQRFAKISS